MRSGLEFLLPVYPRCQESEVPSHAINYRLGFLSINQRDIFHDTVFIHFHSKMLYSYVA